MLVMTSPLQTKLDAMGARGVSPALCRAVGDLVQNGEPAELARLAPPRLARRWNQPEPEVLDAFLAGTREGLFDLEWDLRCLACTGPAGHGEHLAALKNQAVCDVCVLETPATFDESVEVTWRVHPAIRDLAGVGSREVFVAYARPERVTSVTVPAGGEAHLPVQLAPGNYHIFTADHAARCGLRVVSAARAAADGVGTTPLVIDVHERALHRGEWTRVEGPYPARVRNHTDHPIELCVNKVSDEPWVSGARLAAHQSFRDLFAKELIQLDESFAIRSAAFVFTDLKGSTELYERIGDSRAFALVRDHFRIMVEQVRLHGGAMVKTIGDAIMATFISPAQAVRFALSVLKEFDRFNAGRAAGDTHDDRDDVIVKIGIHTGPCIAVTLNERLDYFGRTVNTAARIQGLSEGRDIVLSKVVAEASEVSSLLESAGYARSAFAAALKGIPGEQRLFRLMPR
jgi:class 3 adenylate cyclase